MTYLKKITLLDFLFVLMMVTLTQKIIKNIGQDFLQQGPNLKN